MSKAISANPADQQTTARVLKAGIAAAVNAGGAASVATFDSVGIENQLVGSESGVVGTLLAALPDSINYGGSDRSTAAVVMDAVAKGAALYEREHGHAAPYWVLDSAIRSNLASVDKDYASQIGLDSSYTATLDDASSVSGGAMSVSSIVTAVYRAFADIIPFGGQIAMDKGLEGRIILAGHRAQRATGDYDRFESLDGRNAGKTFMGGTRNVDAETTDNAKYEGTIKLSVGDATGSPILPSLIKVLVNGFIVASAPTASSRGTLVSTFSGNIKLPQGKAISVSAVANCETGKIDATFTPALEAFDSVVFEAEVDFEHEKLKDKRPRVEAYAEHHAIRAKYMTGFYVATEEARHQWNSEVRLDQGAESLYALRAQSGAERHFNAVKSMYRIGKNFNYNFKMDLANRLNERSRESVWRDFNFQLTAVDMDMVSRTNLNGVSVLYVGEQGAAEFASMPAEVFQPSGIPFRPGIFRLGTYLGKYEVYFIPNTMKEEKEVGFDILCIGRSEQVGANPYITGDSLGIRVTPIAANQSGESGQFYFQALAGTVNPHTQAAAAASVISVVY